MSDLLIRGMEMPTSCARCRCVRGCPAVNARIAEMDEHPWFPSDHRHEDCPLVPVPPHGRLIDESAIDLSKYEKAAHDALHNGKGSILYDSGVLAGARAITQLVRRAPTIIPAEEGET